MVKSQMVKDKMVKDKMVNEKNVIGQNGTDKMKMVAIFGINYNSSEFNTHSVRISHK